MSTFSILIALTMAPLTSAADLAARAEAPAFYHTAPPSSTGAGEVYAYNDLVLTPASDELDPGFVYTGPASSAATDYNPAEYNDLVYTATDTEALDPGFLYTGPASSAATDTSGSTGYTDTSNGDYSSSGSSSGTTSDESNWADQFGSAPDWSTLNSGSYSYDADSNTGSSNANYDSDSNTGSLNANYDSGYSDQGSSFYDSADTGYASDDTGYSYSYDY